MWAVKDDKFILTAYGSMSCSLQNSSRLIFVHWRVSCTKILTPSFLRGVYNVYRQVYIDLHIYIISISVCLRWCSIKQSTWRKSGDNKLIKSSNLFNRPPTFWWNTVKFIVLSEFDWGSLLAWGCHLKTFGNLLLAFQIIFLYSERFHNLNRTIYQGVISYIKVYV
jgi:hypothetical protein